MAVSEGFALEVVYGFAVEVDEGFAVEVAEGFAVEVVALLCFDYIFSMVSSPEALAPEQPQRQASNLPTFPALRALLDSS